MKRHISLLSLAAAVALGGSVLVSSASAFYGGYGSNRSGGTTRQPRQKSTTGSRSSTGTKSTKTTKAPEGFLVIQVGDEFKSIAGSELEGEKKKAEDENKKAMDDYKDAKKAATKDKQKFDTPPPKKIRVVIKKNNMKTKEEADKYADKLREAKEDKDSTDTKPKPAT
jgi:hypothetical protein